MLSTPVGYHSTPALPFDVDGRMLNDRPPESSGYSKLSINEGAV